MFEVVSRRAAGRLLSRAPGTGPEAARALATLTARLSGDWLNGRV